MLPKQNRLFLRKEFNRIKKEGRLFQGDFFSLLLAGLSPLEKRFAFIVSKKIHAKAVGRNRIKRWLAEAVQFFLPRLKTGVAGVFLTKKAIINHNFAEIKKEVESIFKKAQLLS